MDTFKPKAKTKKHVKGKCDIVEGICRSCGIDVKGKGKTKEQRELVQLRVPIKNK